MNYSEPKIKFNLECIQHWAGQYDYEGDSGRERECKVKNLVEQVKRQKFLIRSDLKIVGDWKSPRSAGKIDNNKESCVEEVTRFALSTSCDRAAIESLTILEGVGPSIASVILHFFHEKDFPIWDFRARWSVSLNKGKEYKYNYAEWSAYVKYCRYLAKKEGVCMRVLDRALWQYSKCEQDGDKDSIAC